MGLPVWPAMAIADFSMFAKRLKNCGEDGVILSGVVWESSRHMRWRRLREQLEKAWGCWLEVAMRASLLVGRLWYGISQVEL